MISIVVRCRPRKVDTNIKAQVPGDEMMKLGPVGIVPQVPQSNELPLWVDYVPGKRWMTHD